MVNYEGSSADMLLHLEFCVNKSSFCQYYEEDETVVVTKEKYSQYFASTDLQYGVFFRVEDAYDAISKALDGLGVHPDGQTECINEVIRKAQKICVHNMIKADHRENRILCTLDIEDPVDEREDSMEDQDEGMAPVDQRERQDSMEDEDEGMVPVDQRGRQDLTEDQDEGMVPVDERERQDLTEDQDEGMVPAALPAIRSLGATKIEVKDGKNVQQCVICQEEYCNGEKVTCMPCLHMFHRDCITKWLLRNHLCPICRFEMPQYT